MNFFSDLRFLWKCLFPHRAKGVYLGHTGFKNLGDEALREAIYEIFEGRLLLTPCKGKLVRLLERLGIVRFDVLMLGGGTFIFKSQRLLDMLSEPYPLKVVFGTGAENPEFWQGLPKTPSRAPNVKRWIELLRSVPFIGVRGPASKRLLVERGSGGSVSMIGDPVLYFLREMHGRKPRRKRLGLNVGTSKVGGNTDDAVWGRDESSLFARFADFLRMMDQDGWHIEAVPVCAEDVDAVRTVISAAGLERKVRIFDCGFSVKRAIRKMESFDVFVGEKLHSVILAYCANTPAVMVEYMPKCRDFMESIGMSEFNVRTDEMDPAALKALVSRLYSSLEEYRVQCHRKCGDLKKELMEAADEIVSLSLEKR